MNCRSKGILLVISGFAGTGKGTLVQELLKQYDNYALSVSATTRDPRPGEEDGVHYFFKTKEEFEQMIQEKKLIEYAGYVGNYYGTPKEYVQEQLENGKDVILEIEIQGALKIKEQFPETLLLFMVPPSAQVLEDRLRGRGTETEEVVQKRLRRAVEEAEFIEKYDYLIVNDDLDTCIHEAHEIIQSQHHRVDQRTEFLSDLKQQLKRFL